MFKYSSAAVLVSLAFLTSTVSAFDWLSTAESAHIHTWDVPNMGSRVDHQFEVAQRSMLERRAKYGLYIPKATTSVDENLPGILGMTLGFAYGLQYDAKTPGICYTSLESTLTEVDTLLSLLASIYRPD